MPEMISKEILSLVSTFRNPIIRKIGEFADEGKHFLNNNLTPYLDSYYRKYNFDSKTFLFPNGDAEFYDLYFPTPIIQVSKKKTIKTDSINHVFIASRCITVIGIAGSGKSMLVKHLFLNSISEKFKIPIYIELRKLAESGKTIFEYFKDIVFSHKLTPNEKILDRILRSGNFVFLLDGYDEIYSDRKNSITNDIESFIDAFSLNFFLITSRPGANVESMERFVNFKMKNLEEDEIEKFTLQQIQLLNREQELAIKIIETVKATDKKDFLNYLKNPLLLSMYILAFENNPSIPEKKSAFYANVFHTMAIRHDSLSKHGWQHEKKSGLGIEKIRELLRTVSFYSFFEGKYAFSHDYIISLIQKAKKVTNITLIQNQDFLNDCIVAFSLLIQEGNEYRFIHRSMQEFFAAELIADLPIETRMKIYTKNLVNISTNIQDQGNNFWDLCRELDVEGFHIFLRESLNQILSLSGTLNIQELSFQSYKELVLNRYTCYLFAFASPSKERLSGWSSTSIPSGSNINYSSGCISVCRYLKISLDLNGSLSLHGMIPRNSDKLESIGLKPMEAQRFIEEYEANEIFPNIRQKVNNILNRKVGPNKNAEFLLIKTSELFKNENFLTTLYDEKFKEEWDHLIHTYDQIDLKIKESNNFRQEILGYLEIDD